MFKAEDQQFRLEAFPPEHHHHQSSLYSHLYPFSLLIHLVPLFPSNNYSSPSWDTPPHLHNPPSSNQIQRIQHDDESETFINLDLQSVSTDNKLSDHGRFDRDDSRFITTTDEQSQFKSSCDSSFGGGLNNFVRVFIPSHTTEVDLEGKYTSFNLLVQTAFAAVEVKRRYKNFLSLHQDLSQKIPRDRLPQLPKKKRLGVLDPSFVDERKQSLELYLQSLITIREVWNSACFIEFLDLSHPFLGIHLQMTRVTEEVGRLGEENKSLIQQLSYTRAALSNSNQIVTDLLHRLETLEEVIRESLPCPCHPRSQLGGGTSRNLETSQPTVAHALHEPADSNAAVQKEGTQSDQTSQSNWWNEKSQQIDFSPGKSGIFSSVTEMRLPSFAICPETAHVLAAIFPLQEFFQSSALSRLTNTVLSYMTPTVEQLKRRFQVEKYLAKLVRKSLGAQVYQMGLYSIRAFLPDDPVTLSIYLCRGLENSWYLRLNEKLCRMSSSVHAQRDLTDSTDDISSTTPPESQDSLHPSPAHIIKNVSFMEENCEHRLQCVIGTYSVDIRATQKVDLCFAAFIEEIDRTVGRDHLFKKSLILIRAWWTLEASMYTETLPVLSTSAVCVMVCALFSRFHREIYHPIHALMLFLTEYATFDWAKYGLSVYGSIDLSTLETEPLTHQHCLELYPETLISSQMIGKYEEFLRSSDNPERQNSEESDKNSGEKSLLNDLFFSFEGNPNSQSKESKSIAPREKYPGFVPSDCIKIFHPLCLEVNVIPASNSEHYPSSMSEVMVRGRDSILQILSIATEVEQSSAEIFKLSELESKFEDFFRETYSKYSHSWQADLHKTMSFESLLSFELDSSVHDVQKPSTLLFTPTASSDSNLDDSVTNELARDPLVAPLETFLEQIRYCNFLLGTEVSETTLQALSKDILNERGPLPVGEIGKMLQEITGISTLSAYLKDKFGGLKKFLENFPDDFVISTDHPFNPHVFLRSVLSAEEFKLISSGVIPPHLMARSNKRRAARKKRASNNSAPSLYPGDSLSTTLPSGGRGMRTPGQTFRTEGLRSVMSSPYLTSLAQNHQTAYASPGRYQGESWDLSANKPEGRLVHTMSSSALERLGDQHHYRSPSSYNYHSHSQPHSHSPAGGSYLDNYGQYADIAHSSGYRPASMDPVESAAALDLYQTQAYNSRRRSLPTSHAPVGPVSLPPLAHPDGYGHMGIPDPRAPEFFPGTGYS